LSIYFFCFVVVISATNTAKMSLSVHNPDNSYGKSTVAEKVTIP